MEQTQSQVLFKAEPQYQSYRLEKKTQSNKHDFKKNTTYNHLVYLMKLGIYFRNIWLLVKKNHCVQRHTINRKMHIGILNQGSSGNH